MTDHVGPTRTPTTFDRARRAGARFLAGAVLVASATASAGAQSTITFDGLTANDGSGVTRVENCYMEGGIVFTLVGQPCGMPSMNDPAPFYTYTPDNGSYTGSPALFNEAALGTQVRLTGMNGSMFSLFSLDLAPIFLFPGAPGTQMVTFTGMRMGGMMVTQMFDMSLGAGLQRVNLTGFTDLTAVTFDFGNPDGAAQIDNLSVGAQVVPEPSTYLLMASGLLGVGALARRRRSRLG